MRMLELFPALPCITSPTLPAKDGIQAASEVPSYPAHNFSPSHPWVHSVGDCNDRTFGKVGMGSGSDTGGSMGCFLWTPGGKICNV
jgi:hypothetical protein